MVVKINGSAAANVGRALLQAGSATASELADELGLTGAGIRKHLDALLEEGLVEFSERAPYGPAALASPKGRGRPAKVFMLTPKGRGVFGEREESLALTAIKFMASHSGDEAIEAFATQIAKDFESIHSEVTKFATPHERAMALVDALNSDGYVATVTPGLGDAIQICQHNCPMGDVAAQFPSVCEAETEAFSRLTGVHVTRLATIATGNPICTTLVPNARPKSLKG
jgi:predicted ArsR family transcriptional regulator